MIIFDTPKRWPKFGLCAHLISTLPGQPGVEELRRFAGFIDLNRRWLQKPGTPEEHYDIMRGMINRAEGFGARRVTGRQLVAVIRAKRRGEEYDLDGSCTEPGRWPLDVAAVESFAASDALVEHATRCPFHARLLDEDDEKFLSELRKLLEAE